MRQFKLLPVLFWLLKYASALSQQHHSTNKKTPSLGQAIQSASSAASEEILSLCDKFWLPTDQDLPGHYQQLVHHENRQRWASQLLEKIMLSSTLSSSLDLLGDERFARLMSAASYPHPTTHDRPQKEGIWLLNSLLSLHAIVGRQTYRQQRLPFDRYALLDATNQLIARACALQNGYSLSQACQLQWAIEGICSRIPNLADNDNEAFNRLVQRTARLPFQIRPLAVDWKELIPDANNQQDACRRLLDAIPFSKDTIVTRNGAAVPERRGTAWIAKDGIGALAYSGKLMPPQPMPQLVANTMKLVEHKLDLGTDFFDCALCNHYSDATAACKFHTDPEHGSHWDRTTVVLAAGVDRKFSFKPIDTTWEDWDSASTLTSLDQKHQQATTIHLFEGDLVVMRENCNDDFFHSVHAGDSNENRVSLVLKRAITRGNGQKGHGLQGQGRRSRKRAPSSS